MCGSLSKKDCKHVTYDPGRNSGGEAEECFILETCENDRY